MIVGHTVSGLDLEASPLWKVIQWSHVGCQIEKPIASMRLVMCYHLDELTQNAALWRDLLLHK